MIRCSEAPYVLCNSASNCTMSALDGVVEPSDCAKSTNTMDSSKLSVAIDSLLVLGRPCQWRVSPLEPEMNANAEFVEVRLAAELSVWIHTVIDPKEIRWRELAEQSGSRPNLPHADHDSGGPLRRFGAVGT